MQIFFLFIIILMKADDYCVYSRKKYIFISNSYLNKFDRFRIYSNNFEYLKILENFIRLHYFLDFISSLHKILHQLYICEMYIYFCILQTSPL